MLLRAQQQALRYEVEHVRDLLVVVDLGAGGVVLRTILGAWVCIYAYNIYIYIYVWCG